MIEQVDYEMLDSGKGMKLERFGRILISRPSSIAIWNRRFQEKWEKIDGFFDPSSGWIGIREGFEWECSVFGVKMRLRTQSNGQIGIFPEHFTLLNYIKRDLISELSNQGRSGTILNLFGYTGLASIFSIKHGLQVTHVDLSKRALDWARSNLDLNKYDSSQLRLIPEDAIKYMRRLVRRGERYDYIVADPPSFSRIDKTTTWQAEDILKELFSAISKVSSIGAYISCHLPAIGAPGLKNLALDEFNEVEAIESHDLLITESLGTRQLLYGSGVAIKR